MLNNVVSIFSGVAAAAGDYESIATVTVGSGGSSNIEFNSIPSTYTHLQLRGIQKFAASGELSLRFNNDNGASSYANHILYGTGASASAYGTGSQPDIDWPCGPTSTTQFSAFVIDILDYANTNKNKTLRALSGVDNNGSGEVRLSSGVWLFTTAINRINIIASSSNVVQYSHFALYGLRGA